MDECIQHLPLQFSYIQSNNMQSIPNIVLQQTVAHYDRARQELGPCRALESGVFFKTESQAQSQVHPGTSIGSLE